MDEQREPEKHGRITLVFRPTVAIIAQMEIVPEGIRALRNWLEIYRPDCLPPETDGDLLGLLPHDGQETTGDIHGFRKITDNEKLVELAGRKCYNSFGLKAGRKRNSEYIQNTQTGDIPHRSIMYHAKLTFLIAGVSRRVSHELIRNYVGADRDEEGSPSQESTRYTHHPGHFIVHPTIEQKGPNEINRFAKAMDEAYGKYLDYIKWHFDAGKSLTGSEPKGIERKRIYESGSMFLPHSCETSWMWTTNPVAWAKLIQERENVAADMEIQRLAKRGRLLAVGHAPNLFPQPWMVHGPDWKETEALRLGAAGRAVK